MYTEDIPSNIKDFLDYRDENLQMVSPEFLLYFTSGTFDHDPQYNMSLTEEDPQDDYTDESEDNIDDYLSILRSTMDTDFSSTPRPVVEKKTNTTVTTLRREQLRQKPSEIEEMISDVQEEYNNRYRISSDFGHRKAPSTGSGTHGSTDHKGVDLACPIGTKLTVPMEGTVEKVAYQDSHNGKAGAGHYISIKLKNGKYLVFMHLKEAPNLAAGDKVTPGLVVALSGNTGAPGMGAHVHVGYSSTGYSSGARNWERCPNNILNRIFTD